MGEQVKAVTQTAQRAPENDTRARAERPRAPWALPVLILSTPGDVFEREANDIAGKVLGDETGGVTVRPADPAYGQTDTQPEHAGLVRDALTSPGQSLDAETRTRMEARFGRDFSRVRIHAHAGPRALNTRAFVVGEDIVFVPGAYAPHRPEGLQVLAHELAHVAQQQMSRGEASLHSFSWSGSSSDASPLLFVQRYSCAEFQANVKKDTKEGPPTKTPGPNESVFPDMVFLVKTEIAKRLLAHRADDTPKPADNPQTVQAVQETKKQKRSFRQDLDTSKKDNDKSVQDAQEALSKTTAQGQEAAAKADDDASAKGQEEKPPDLATVIAQGVHFAEPEITGDFEDEIQRQNALIQAQINKTRAEEAMTGFARQGAEVANSYRALGMTLEGRLDEAAQAAKEVIQASAAEKRDAIKQTIKDSRKEVSGREAGAKKKLKRDYDDTVKALDKTYNDEWKAVQSAYDTDVLKMGLLEFGVPLIVTGVFAAGSKHFENAGKAVADEAKQIAGEKAVKYVTPRSGNGGFFKGKNYWRNRQDARANASRAVGCSYYDAYVQQGKDAAAQAMKGVPDVEIEIGKQTAQSRDQMLVQRNGAQGDLQSAHKAALDSARVAYDNSLEAIEAAADETRAALKRLEKVQLKQLDEYEQQQLLGIDVKTSTALGELVNGVDLAAVNLERALAEMLMGMAETRAPAAEALAKMLVQHHDALDVSRANTEAAVEDNLAAVIDALLMSVLPVLEQIEAKLQETKDQSKPMTEAFDKSAWGATNSASKGFKAGVKDHDSGAKDTSQHGVDAINGAYDTAFNYVQQIATKMPGTFEAKGKEFQKGLSEALHGRLPDTQDIVAEIEKAAEEAADKVKPAWREVLGFILDIIITVVVAVAIAALVASGVGLGLGLLLAAGIGAAGGLAKAGVEYFVKDNPITLKDVGKMMALGALDGMLQFLGGRFMAGKLTTKIKIPETGWKRAAIEGGVNFGQATINDTAKLAADGKLTWSNFTTTVVQNGWASSLNIVGQAKFGAYRHDATRKFESSFFKGTSGANKEAFKAALKQKAREGAVNVGANFLSDKELTGKLLKGEMPSGEDFAMAGVRAAGQEVVTQGTNLGLRGKFFKNKPEVEQAGAGQPRVAPPDIEPPARPAAIEAETAPPAATTPRAPGTQVETPNTGASLQRPVEAEGAAPPAAARPEAEAAPAGETPLNKHSLEDKMTAGFDAIGKRWEDYKARLFGKKKPEPEGGEPGQTAPPVAATQTGEQAPPTTAPGGQTEQGQQQPSAITSASDTGEAGATNTSTAPPARDDTTAENTGSQSASQTARPAETSERPTPPTTPPAEAPPQETTTPQTTPPTTQDEQASPRPNADDAPITSPAQPQAPQPAEQTHTATTSPRTEDTGDTPPPARRPQPDEPQTASQRFGQEEGAPGPARPGAAAGEGPAPAAAPTAAPSAAQRPPAESEPAQAAQASQAKDEGQANATATQKQSEREAGPEMKALTGEGQHGEAVSKVERRLEQSDSTKDALDVWFAMGNWADRTRWMAHEMKSNAAKAKLDAARNEIHEAAVSHIAAQTGRAPADVMKDLRKVGSEGPTSDIDVTPMGKNTVEHARLYEEGVKQALKDRGFSEAQAGQWRDVLGMNVYIDPQQKRFEIDPRSTDPQAQAAAAQLNMQEYAQLQLQNRDALVTQPPRARAGEAPDQHANAWEQFKAESIQQARNVDADTADRVTAQLAQIEQLGQQRDAQLLSKAQQLDPDVAKMAPDAALQYLRNDPQGREVMKSAKRGLLADEMTTLQQMFKSNNKPDDQLSIQEKHDISAQTLRVGALQEEAYLPSAVKSVVESQQVLHQDKQMKGEPPQAMTPMTPGERMNAAFDSANMLGEHAHQARAALEAGLDPNAAVGPVAKYVARQMVEARELGLPVNSEARLMGDVSRYLRAKVGPEMPKKGVTMSESEAQAIETAAIAAGLMERGPDGKARIKTDEFLARAQEFGDTLRMGITARRGLDADMLDSLRPDPDHPWRAAGPSEPTETPQARRPIGPAFDEERRARTEAAKRAQQAQQEAEPATVVGRPKETDSTPEPTDTPQRRPGGEEKLKSEPTRPAEGKPHSEDLGVAPTGLSGRVEGLSHTGLKSRDEAESHFRQWADEDPLREVALLYDHKAKTYIVIQGGPNRVRAALKNKDVSVVKHLHTGAEFAARMPSAADFFVLTGQHDRTRSVQSEVAYLDPRTGEYAHTQFGFEPATRNQPEVYWVRYTNAQGKMVTRTFNEPPWHESSGFGTWKQQFITKTPPAASDPAKAAPDVMRATDLTQVPTTPPPTRPVATPDTDALIGATSKRIQKMMEANPALRDKLVQVANDAEAHGMPMDPESLRRYVGKAGNPDELAERLEKLSDIVEDMKTRGGTPARAQVARHQAEIAEDIDPSVPQPDTMAVPKQKSDVRTSHDAGVEGGMQRAQDDGITVLPWNNPQSHIPDYGRGIDGLGQLPDGRWAILEWKGERSDLRGDQMTAAWVGRKIAELEYLNDPIANDLLAAARRGELVGIVYRTRILKGRQTRGQLRTYRRDMAPYNLAEIEAAYQQRLAELAAQ